MQKNLNSLKGYMQDVTSIVTCDREMAQKLSKSISQNKLDADLPGMIKKSMDMEREYEKAHGDAIEITIADNGRGIPPENFTLVFNLFFTTKEIGKGVGLGLTTALNIIKMHNGSIHCQSEPDKETALTVQLPCNGGGF